MSRKRIAIVQSNYIPWKGYFDLIHRVDEFVLYDDAQYTRRDWRNRNRIKTANGCLWLTIPVQVKGRYYQKIKETEVSDQQWREQHWKSIQACYARAPYFPMYKDWLADLYLGNSATLLSEVNYQFLTAFCATLGITTPLTWSSQYELGMGKN
ncbi:MAG: WbqC family protein [Deltaproteobacteria bacterium]|nr:WbqC family protein [Deltaproteobacteria bacterium]